MMRLSLLLSAMSLLATQPALAQDEAAPELSRGAALVAANSFAMDRDGDVWSGAGVARLSSDMDDARYLLIAEPHNMRDVNAFTGWAYNHFSQEAGVNRLVIEQDPVLVSQLEAMAEVLDRDTFFGFAAQNYFSLHFFTDSELDLIYDVARSDMGGLPNLWGVDRALGVMPSLKVMAEITEDGAEAALVSEALEMAAAHNGAIDILSDPQGAPQRRFMTQDNAQFDAILEKLAASGQVELAKLAKTLMISRSNIRDYEIDHGGVAWGYSNNAEREELMKHNLSQHLAGDGDMRSKAIVKMGGWHVSNGHSPNRLSTLGNAMDGLATLEGSDAVFMTILAVNRPGVSYSITDNDDYDIFDSVADPDATVLVDLRALRDDLYAGNIKVEPSVSKMIYGYDYALLVGGLSAGGYDRLFTIASQGLQ